jgi:hypothetical protein
MQKETFQQLQGAQSIHKHGQPPKVGFEFIADLPSGFPSGADDRENIEPNCCVECAGSPVVAGCLKKRTWVPNEIFHGILLWLKSN